MLTNADSMSSLCSGLTVLLDLFRICCGRWRPSIRWAFSSFRSLNKSTTSTPTGKMIFTVLGAVAELERNLIVERVRAGLRHARSKGKQLGRPRKAIDASQIRSLRDAGISWRAIARELGVSVGTVLSAAKNEG
jgi:DNA invertase Pin-like site-specific DNA recombinase